MEDDLKDAGVFQPVDRGVDWRELRSGNLVQGKPISIPRMGWHGNGITRITAYGIHMLEQGVGAYKPIHLTPEILEKAGFKKWGVGDKKYPGEVLYHKDIMTTDRLMWSAYEKRVCFCTDTYQELGHRVFYRPRIDYLHQLQNAFFAFYSEELAISL